MSILIPAEAAPAGTSALPAQHAVPLEAPAKAIADLRFLVVEDHDFQRWVVGSILKDLGARHVFQAADGRAALEIFRNMDPPIDIIISDLDMPFMDGMEFMRHVGEIGVPVSVIITSAMDHTVIASVQLMTKAYGLDLLGAIDKPVKAAELGELVARRNPDAARQIRGAVATQVHTIEEMIRGLDNDEFEPWFQPKIEIATGKIKGAEALARWRRPDGARASPAVPPGVFIAALEASGDIDRLTWMILRKAAAFCRSWRRAGLDATVSVNLSGQSLADLTLVDRITQIVLEHELDPKDVVLEVTESAALTDLGGAIENLSRLRMRGFSLSIDDYGTGYSTMAQLSRIPFNELKIDQSFVRNATGQEHGRIILDSTLNLARSLDIPAVAEGVETQADWDMLKELRCDLAQGYFIAMPMPGPAFLEWVKGRK
jgi:EAL domain-containing protein (putative c-di-GMP-specific phosphodiesterase class I)